MCTCLPDSMQLRRLCYAKLREVGLTSQTLEMPCNMKSSYIRPYIERKKKNPAT